MRVETFVGAILILAMNGPSQAQPVPMSNAATGSPQVSSTAVAAPQSSAATPLASERAAVTDSPTTWGIVATGEGSPQVLGLRLGGAESDFTSNVPYAVCEDKQTLPPTRECKGSLAGGYVRVEADFLHDALYEMTFEANLAPDDCQLLEDILKAKLGKKAAHGFASGLLSMLIPGTARYWGNKQWAAGTACLADPGTTVSDAFLMVSSEAGTKVIDSSEQSHPQPTANAAPQPTANAAPQPTVNAAPTAESIRLYKCGDLYTTRPKDGQNCVLTN